VDDERTENPTTGGTPADDTAFARLQAADPAAGSTPDLPALYAAVAERSGVPVGAPQDELAARRARRAPRWLAVAAAVAGVAVIGGGGYAYGLNSAPETVTAAPAIALDPAAARGGEVTRAAEAMAGDGVASTKMIQPWWGGRTVFTADGLSTEGGSGTAWGFDAADAYSEETVAAAAAALGVSGQPRLEYGTWSVGPNDGSGPSVSLSPDGLASLSYYDPTRDPWSCVRSAPDTLEEPALGTADGEVAVPEPATDGTGQACDPAAAAPTGDAAVAQAKDVLSSVGVDPAGYQFAAATDPASPQVTTVTATQVIDDQQTGVTGSVTVVADGVQSLNAPLAPLVELGSYDVVSPTEAVARLGDPRFGASAGGWMMVPDVMRAAGDAVVPAGPSVPTVPATPAAGDPIAWPVQQVTLVSARLGLALTTLPTGASVLVPTYELADAAGSTWSVIAVVDDQLDFAAAG
jgi:hypothetical protein